MKEDTCGDTAMQPDVASSVSSMEPEWGWYVYGVTRPGQPGEAELVIGTGLDGDARIQVFSCGQIAAIVSPVPLSEFGPEPLRARLADVARLEAMVRGHERVVEAVQRQGTILPTRFGCVYSSTAELVDALEAVHESLLVQLGRLEGCDEWGVRLYTDRKAIERRIASDLPAVCRLNQELQEARPGRAYFLQRTLADVLTAATEQMLSDLAQAGYDHLVHYAVDGQISPRPSASGVSNGEVEILRAAFLVSRIGLPTFVEEIHRFTEQQAGLRCEYSGPWPAYSFVGRSQETVP